MDTNLSERPKHQLSYAGVGSRGTPVDILEKFEIIGFFLAKRGYLLRSGGADGADSAFEKGCDLAKGRKEIFLPWKGFNGNNSNLFKTPKGAEKFVEKIHPAWHKLKIPVKQLHARNVCQILGYSLDDPVEFVLCYTKDALGKGGTATAINLAKSMGIPVFDFGESSNIDKFRVLFEKLKND